MIIQILISVLLVSFAILLIAYDRNKNLKRKHIESLSKSLFRNKPGENSSVARLHQTILGVLFIFCIGIAALFIVGLLK